MRTHSLWKIWFVRLALKENPTDGKDSCVERNLILLGFFVVGRRDVRNNTVKVTFLGKLGGGKETLFFQQLQLCHAIAFRFYHL